MIEYFPDAVTNEKGFYGRKTQWEEEIEPYLQPGSRKLFLILGERRIGKTSFQNIVANRMQSSFNHVPLKIEPRGIKSLDVFAHSILYQLASHTGNDLHETGLVRENGQIHLEFVEIFKPAFRKLATKSQNITYLLCIDEFDIIIRQSKDEFSRIEALIRLISNESDLPISLLFTMNQHLEESIRFDELTKPLRLGLFSFEEMREMVCGILSNQLILPETEMERLFEISAGHPYFVKLLISNMMDLCRPKIPGTIITPTIWQQVLEKSVHDPNAEETLVNIYKDLFNDEQKRFVLLLAKHNSLLSVQSLPPDKHLITEARKLIRRNYIKKDKDSYSFRIQFIHFWLQEWIEFEEQLENLHIPFLVTVQPKINNAATEKLKSALEIAERALAILEQQAAGYASLAIPVHLQIELEDKRKQVASLKEALGLEIPPSDYS